MLLHVHGGRLGEMSDNRVEVGLRALPYLTLALPISSPLTFYPPDVLLAGSRSQFAQLVVQVPPGTLGDTSAEKTDWCRTGLPMLRWKLTHLEQLLDPGTLWRYKNISAATPALGESLSVTACKIILHLNFIYKSWFLQTSSNRHRWPLNTKK